MPSSRPIVAAHAATLITTRGNGATFTTFLAIPDSGSPAPGGSPASLGAVRDLEISSWHYAGITPETVTDRQEVEAALQADSLRKTLGTHALPDIIKVGLSETRTLAQGQAHQAKTDAGRTIGQKWRRGDRRVRTLPLTSRTTGKPARPTRAGLDSAQAGLAHRCSSYHPRVSATSLRKSGSLRFTAMR